MDKEKIRKIIEEFIQKIDFPVEEVVFSEEDNESIWCSIKTNQPQFFLGKTGENLMAINHLLKKMIDNLSTPQKDEGFHITIDVNNYQKKRVEGLKTTAHMMAERARFFKSSVEVEPMSAYERRIIHEFISKQPDLETESVGEGKERRVVIKYKIEN